MKDPTIRIDNRLTITGAPAHLARLLRERLTFVNPAWEENEKHGFSNWQTERELCFLEENGDRLAMPRGFARQALGLLKRHGIGFEIDDRRRTLPPVDFAFCGKLRGFQAEAVKAITARDFGTLAAPTGSGKTVMALYVGAQRRQPALIVTHTKELLEQWVDRIETLLGIPEKKVGLMVSWIKAKNS